MTIRSRFWIDFLKEISPSGRNDRCAADVISTEGRDLEKVLAWKNQWWELETVRA
jgi:hypothetical protein